MATQRPPQPATPPVSDELKKVLLQMRGHFIAAGTFSFFINVLMLVPALYMLQVYDRVLGSRNPTTLWMLTILMVAMYVLLAGMEWTRSRLLVRAGLQMDAQLSSRVFNASFRNSLRFAGSNAGQFMMDFTNVRQFLTGNGLFAFFDAPWTPIYLIVIFLMHPWLGFFSLAGAILLVFMTWLTERATHEPLAQANAAALTANNFVTNSLRNAEVIDAMGMLPKLRERWYQRYRKMLALQTLASERAGSISATTRFIRITMQSMILGLGALLVIDGQVSAGMMIAASILMGRALAPVELAIGTWKNFVSTRAAYERLEKLLGVFPAEEPKMSLPAPKGEVAVEALVAGAPGGTVPIIRGVQFQIPAGSIVGMIGPSASGKSTLARLLVGVWGPMSGTVRLDGANVFTWNKDELGQYVGYLPQDIELFDGTVAENIARFGDLDSERVITASKLAGVHEMVLRLPQGYDTPIGVGGSVLSGGQRQRVALARALYGSPSFIVLDEPNSNLDDVGEAALVQALRELKAQGKTVVVITHRLSTLAVVDKLMVMREGQLHTYGPRDDVLRALQAATAQAQPAAAAPAPVQVQSSPPPAHLMRPVA